MNIKHTARGFQIINFTDADGQNCTLQQSSLADFVIPGTSAIWFGVGDHRMHIRLSQAEKLVKHLRAWVENGTFDLDNGRAAAKCDQKDTQTPR